MDAWSSTRSSKECGMDIVQILNVEEKLSTVDMRQSEIQYRFEHGTLKIVYSIKYPGTWNITRQTTVCVNT